MKRIFLLGLAIALAFSLAACGGKTEAAHLVDITTEQGISLKLPSDMTLQENHSYVNTETGDSAVFGMAAVGETPLSGWTEENVLATYQSSYPDAAVTSFENGLEINGSEALVSSVAMTTPGGNAVTTGLVIVTDGETNYVTSFTYASETKDSSLANNLQTCIDSITITQE